MRTYVISLKDFSLCLWTESASVNKDNTDLWKKHLRRPCSSRIHNMQSKKDFFQKKHVRKNLPCRQFLMRNTRFYPFFSTSIETSSFSCHLYNWSIFWSFVIQCQIMVLYILLYPELDHYLAFSLPLSWIKKYTRWNSFAKCSIVYFENVLLVLLIQSYRIISVSLSSIALRIILYSGCRKPVMRKKIQKS